MLTSLLRRAIGLLLSWPLLASAQGFLENPQPDAVESGIGVISGWHCTAREVTISIDGVSLGKAGSGTLRIDTDTVCGGRTQSGFSLLYNFSRLAPGPHRIDVYVDGALFATRNFRTVRSGGVEFLQGATGEYRLSDFPSPGKAATVTWSQARQGFVVTDIGDDADLPALACSKLAQAAGTWSMRYTIASEFSTTLRFTGTPTPTGEVLAPCAITGTDATGRPDVAMVYSAYTDQYVVVDLGTTFNDAYVLRLTGPSRMDGYYYQQFASSEGPAYPAYALKTAATGGAPGLSVERMGPLQLEVLKLEESSVIASMRRQVDAPTEQDLHVRRLAAKLRDHLRGVPWSAR